VEKRTMSLDNSLRLLNALHVSSLFLLYDQVGKMPEVEWIQCILRGRSESQKEYLLHMLQAVAEGMDKLM
jgi:hypothetical protein